MSNNAREIRDLVAAAEKAGWTIRDGKHFLCFSPDGVTKITVSKTPPSPRRVTRYREQFRKLGVDC